MRNQVTRYALNATHSRPTADPQPTVANHQKQDGCTRSHLTKIAVRICERSGARPIGTPPQGTPPPLARLYPPSLLKHSHIDTKPAGMSIQLQNKPTCALKVGRLQAGFFDSASASVVEQ